MRDIWHHQSYSLPEDPGFEKSGNTGLCSSFTGSGLWLSSPIIKRIFY